MMTPFAQLEKSAHTAPATGFKYQKGASGLNNPYAPQVSKQPAAKGFGWGDGALAAADFGLGSIPVVGGLWGLGRAGWDAAHGNWAGAAGNLAIAGMGAVGLGGAGAAARAGLAAGKAGLAARAGAQVAKIGTGTGVAAKGAQGLMHAGVASDALKASGNIIHKGTQGVANPFNKGWLNRSGNGRLGQIGPITSGRATHAGAVGTAYTVPGMILPDGSPKPLAPAPAPRNPNQSITDWGANMLINGPQ